ncbi:oligopeptide ABC transporter substrate-binding protein [Leptotrichia sp. OH3620_COT-345]|uniref:oligopeptide ABC transporter substrate-binding protein n=1 Tax=Leptotrichia sp. OH3620_COT-345 TaxID=2491048 RepID=UPI000F64A84D|nr:oligopeptide ABC transporter substrate-binding protein [Leptotrichia sp. OH3620_COT-345]RRD41026.1 oligopeptide ABC transporter substrate-binding protein [Leptotrichia sp. OH3620_COT-345]
MKKKSIVLGFILSIMMLLTACGPGERKSKGVEGVDASKFPRETVNDAKAVEGATLKVALVTDSPIKGVLNEAFYQDAYDGEILDYFVGSDIFDTDNNFEVTDTGAVTLTVDADNKKAVIKIKDGIKWSDGQPLVADDLIYAYEIIGHKDYTGVRYNDERKKIVGIEDYHNGKSETISGIKKIDDKTIEMSFTEMGQGIYTIGNGLVGYALPKHHLKDVPVKDMISSEKIRNNIVTLGPYIPVKVVQGESIELKANPYYYKGKAKTERVTIQVVNSKTISAALRAGEYDLALQIPGDLYNTFKDLDNITILGRQELYYSYMGFKLGYYNKEKKENVTDPSAKMGDVKLRQALAYALDIDEMAKAFYHGLRERATSAVPPVFKKYYPEGIAGYPYDLEKAKKLLDEAGYKDVNGDGFREDKNGKPFEVRIASMAGGDIAEPLVQFYIQKWKEVGIKGVLTTGRLIEFNSFYDKVEADDKEIDVFFAAWGVGTNLNPYGTKGRSAKFNYTRFVSEENDRLMAETAGEKALKVPGYKAEAYKKWQEYFLEQAVEIPLTYRYELFPVNKRVKNYNTTYDKGVWRMHLVELTAKEPIKASK